MIALKARLNDELRIKLVIVQFGDNIINCSPKHFTLLILLSGLIKLIEDYPDDIRGHSCLLLGYGIEERIIHVVCSPKEDYLALSALEKESKGLINV